MCAPDGREHLVQIATIGQDRQVDYRVWTVCPYTASMLALQLGTPDAVTSGSIAPDPARESAVTALLAAARLDATQALSALQLGVLDGPDGRPVQVDTAWSHQMAVDAARLALRLTEALGAVATVAAGCTAADHRLLLDAIHDRLTRAEGTDE